MFEAFFLAHALMDREQKYLGSSKNTHLIQVFCFFLIFLKGRKTLQFVQNTRICSKANLSTFKQIFAFEQTKTLLLNKEKTKKTSVPERKNIAKDAKKHCKQDFCT